MTVRRHALIIATQCQNMNRLDQLEPAAGELARVLLDPDLGDCRPGLPDGEHLIGEKSQAEIEKAVRDALSYAAEHGATLILAFLGHGFLSDGNTNLYLMAAQSLEDVASTAVDIPGLLAVAANEPNVEGIIALVDTCHAGGATAPKGAVAGGAREGRTTLEVLMACGSRQAAVNFRLTTALCALLVEGRGQSPTINLSDLLSDLNDQVGGQAPALSTYHGEARRLWISHNRREAAPDQGMGVFGAGRYREFIRKALPDVDALPSLAMAIGLLKEQGSANGLARAEMFRTVQRTVELLRNPPLRPLITTERLRRAAGFVLPDHLVADQIDAEVVAYLVLNPPAAQNDGHGDLMRFVLRLAHACGVDFEDSTLKRWIDTMGIAPAAVNDFKADLQRSPEPMRLVVSVHASLTGDWPESVSACLQLDGQDLYYRRYACAPTVDGVNSAIADAVLDADQAAKDRDVRCRRIDVAAPAGLLLGWRPEEIDDEGRLGANHDFVLHWSERLKQSRRMSRLLGLLHERPLGSPRFSRLERYDLGDLDTLGDRLYNQALSSAVVLGHRPDDAEDLLTLLLFRTPYVIWPAEPGDNRTSSAELDRYWHKLPIGFSAAYRARWSGQPEFAAIAGLRAVWDDEHWLNFCRAMPARSDREEAA